MNLDYVPFYALHLSSVIKSLKFAILGFGVLLAIIAFRALISRMRTSHVAQLGGLTWKRNQFCRGWLITGDTGSGKTSSGINQLAHQVFQNEPKWGGLCIDEKGVYWETLAAMAKFYGRERTARLEAKVGSPFEKEERYHHLARRQSEIEEQLDLTKNQAPSQVDAAVTEERQDNTEKQTETQSIQQTRRAAVHV